MALFGLPRAIAGDAWWTDARIWFALATAAALVAAVATLRRTGHRPTGSDRPGRDSALVRAVQLATVLPICALTLATGGDDLPVLALVPARPGPRRGAPVRRRRGGDRARRRAEALRLAGRRWC